MVSPKHLLLVGAVAAVATLGLLCGSEGGGFSLTKSDGLSAQGGGLVFAEAAGSPERDEELRGVLKAAKRKAPGDHNVKPSDAKRARRDPYAAQKEALLEELEKVLEMVRESRRARGLNPDDVKPSEVLEAVKQLQKDQEEAAGKEESGENSS